MPQQEAPLPPDVQTLTDQQIEDLAHRSVWHWRQALWWVVLGVMLLNLPWLAGVATGLGAYGLIGLGASGLWALERSNALRWLERLRVVKWFLMAVYPAATLVTVIHVVAAIHPPIDLSRWAALPNIFRMSAHYDRSPYSTGWAGEGWVLAALIFAAVLHMVINELVFPADLAFRRRWFPLRAPLAVRATYWVMLAAIVFILLIQLDTVRHGGSQRGQMFNANSSALWPLPWWAALSCVVVLARFLRVCSAQVALHPDR